MGTDKAFLRLGSATLLEHQISVVQQVCDTVVLIGDKQRLAPYAPIIEDRFPGQGPLAGIHAALTSPHASGWNLVLAVDLPNLTPEFLTYLLTTAVDASQAVAVPYANGFFQPLCAVYSRDFARIAERSLTAGRNKIDPLFTEVSTHQVSEADLRNHGFSPSIFDNVNTPEEWEAFQRRIGTSK